MKFDIREYLDYKRINLIKNFFVNNWKKFTGLFKPGNGTHTFDLISIGMIIIGILFVIVATVKGQNGQAEFKLVTALWVVAFLIINDVIEPAVKGELKTMPKERMNIYLKYVIFDVTGFMCLVYFALFAGEYRNVFHYIGLAVFVLLIKPKRDTYEEFIKENA